MSSSPIREEHPKNPGSATVPNGTILYIYNLPEGDGALVRELRVLDAFLKAWNEDRPVCTELFPDSTVSTHTGFKSVLA